MVVLGGGAVSYERNTPVGSHPGIEDATCIDTNSFPPRTCHGAGEPVRRVWDVERRDSFIELMTSDRKLKACREGSK